MFLVLVLSCAAAAQDVDLVGTPAEDAGSQMALNVYIGDGGRALVTGAVGEDSLQQLGLEQGYEYDAAEGQLYGYTQALTSKSGGAWSFLMPLSGNFDDYYVAVYLPETAQVTGVDSGGLSYSVGREGNTLLVEFDGFGVADPEVGVSYRIGAPESLPQGGFPIQGEGRGFELSPFVIVAIIAVVVVVILVVRYGGGRRSNRGNAIGWSGATGMGNNVVMGTATLPVTGEMERVMRTLNEAERSVVGVIVRQGGKATQNRVRQETGMPKSSLSGIVANLETKGVLKRFKHGNTNDLELTPWFIGKTERS